MPAFPDQVFRVSRHVFSTPVSTGIALLDMRNGQCYELDAVGTKVFACMTSGATVREAAASVAEEFDAAQDVIQDDVGALTKELAASGLLEPGDRDSEHA